MLLAESGFDDGGRIRLCRRVEAGPAPATPEGAVDRVPRFAGSAFVCGCLVGEGDPRWGSLLSGAGNRAGPNACTSSRVE